MLCIWLVLLAILLMSSSGLPALLLSRHSSLGQRLTSLLLIAGSLLGLVGTVLALNMQEPPSLQMPWLLPLGMFAVKIDAISALFLLLVFIVPALGSVYGLGYWKQKEHPENGRRLGLFYGVLAGSMALVSISRDGILFLMAWEVMALSAFFAASVDEENPEVRRAGWIYLVATHVGTLALLAMFALWHTTTGSYAMEVATAIPAGFATPIFILSVVGFGAKAGLIPLHVWLPGAHANAPSHVSAVMSGVMLKMGIYGIVRMTSLLPIQAGWWGGSLMVIGAVTGVAGIAFAIGQHDLKRMLAYSSIENMGIIAMGIGLAVYGRYCGQMDWVLLGLGGALLHVWNHGLFKPLLFLNAGAIIHGTGSREIDRMGGLAKRMPRAMILFAVGSVAICALPPLNGFASEWLLYLGFFRTLGLADHAGLPVLASAAVALALIGALAVAGFVKLFATIFLGSPRSASTEHTHDPSLNMILPMAVLALGCVLLGAFSILVFPLLERAVQLWSGTPVVIPLLQLAPAQWLLWASLGLLLPLGILFFTWKFARGSKPVVRTCTWDCGYAQPTARMQYTGSSFGQSIVNLFRFILWPRFHQPTIRAIFPAKTQFKTMVPDTILDRMILPAFHYAGRKLLRIHILQQGQTHLYLLYIVAIVFILLIFGG